MSDGQQLPGDLGAATSLLGLLNALDQGNIGAAIVSGVSLADAVGNGVASRAICDALGLEAGSAVPVLGLALATKPRMDTHGDESPEAAEWVILIGSHNVRWIVVRLFNNRPVTSQFLRCR